MMFRDQYKRLGDYIHQVDVRNRDLAVHDLKGLSMTKEFRESTSNIVGVDLSKYKVVNPGVFAFDTMSVIRVHKVPIILNTGNVPVIISPAYITFVSNDENILDSNYLRMWVRRPEFDRYADFKSDAAVRGGYGWDELCDTLIRIPTIEEQRRIVAEYQAVEKRIATNERLIAKLEETAQTIYKKMFVDDIDPAHLPDYLHLSTVGDFCQKTTSGGTPSRTTQEFWVNGTINWLKSGEVHNNVILDTEEQITQSAVKGSAAKLIPSGSVIMAMYGATAGQVAYLQTETTTNQACCNMICSDEKRAAYLFFHLLFNQDSIKRLANGGAQENLSQDLITKTHVFDSSDKNLFTPFSTILNEIVALSKENKVNYTLNSLLLSRLSE